MLVVAGPHTDRCSCVGDEASPVCGPCSKVGRYCDRTTTERRFVAFAATGEAAWSNEKASSSSLITINRECLEKPEIAGYFHHYITHVAPWYDLGDESRHFALTVPRLALDQPLLLGAIIALSAIHVAQSTGSATAKRAAEVYHGHCIRSLIELDQSSVVLENGVALAATCLLRSFEILNEVHDPQRHLRGAYSLASQPAVVRDGTFTVLHQAGFWNYLREDITFSLFEGCPLKVDLDLASSSLAVTAARCPLDSISLLLGQILNAVHTSTMSCDIWSEFQERLTSWYSSLPLYMHPFSTGTQAARSIEGPLPRSWFLQDTYASAMHYFLTATCVLTTCASENQLPHMAQLSGIGKDKTPSKEDILEYSSLNICGIAFTTNTPSVLVNAFGPMFYCESFLSLKECAEAYSIPQGGNFIRQEAARQEIIRHLHACKKIVGWPVERVVNLLCNEVAEQK
ncbi:hypothetical protein PFICI_10819 [Pestalotiopsis fici W106-1]|uniref:Zn(2)-C6 fungal-type domain-containing protein n=1 Tax=Pestalotiopsis fici (strain W106-1 / CGMCC3.15140) TaxID=1229662 RepID=W3WSV8_PESFW|nr:uncharacterized protein PFICI_10819 [Pestalotiopsis fici W106-1]ETS76945.1 hypothetical protein PFICI_10819 [Pestalotiopsis fici W106-1]